MIKELQTIYSSQVSFWDRAHTITTYEDNKKIIELRSYSTIVARYTYDGAQHIYEYLGYYSRTTTKHQKEFFLQQGLSEEQYNKLRQKQILIINE